MYFPRLRTYNKVFVAVIGLGILGIVFIEMDICEKLKNLPHLFTYAEESILPRIKFRRNLASKLLKAAEDVRWGRHAVAISEIRAAAAILDRRYYYSIMMNPSSQPGWVSPHLPPKKSSRRISSNPLSLSPMNLNMNISQNENNDRLFPEIDVESVLNRDSSGDLSSIVTILIDECKEISDESRKEKTGRIVSQMREQWASVKIIIGVDRAKLSELGGIQNGNDVFVIDVTCDKWNRAPVEPFLRYVTSPYVLFLESTAAVTSDLNITRLLRVSTGMRRVGVVGIAERGADGGWDYTCSQLYQRQAHLSITDGYEYSQAACLFCDVTSLSFLAATNVLQTVQPDSSLPISSRQIDWALRLHDIDVLTMTCPDVMIHTTNKIIPSVEDSPNVDHPCATKEEKVQARNKHLLLRRLYRKLAQRHELSSISFPNRTRIQYDCLEIHYECNVRSKVQEFLLHPCCLKLKNKLLRNYNFFTKESLIPYTVEAGTLLGAVKFRHPIPWDFDDDSYYENSNINIFKKNKERMKQMGISPSFQVVSQENGWKYDLVFIEGKGGFSLESSGVKQLPNELSTVEVKNLPKNIPCLQYGHYPTTIGQFLKNSSHITNHIINQRKNETGTLNKKRAEVPSGNKIERGRLQPKNYPPIPKATCYLYTFVRIDNLWVPASLNPGLRSLEKFGDGLFKHEPHWRFKQNLEGGWPHCSIPDHPMCLNIHPTDGTVSFS